MTGLILIVLAAGSVATDYADPIERELLADLRRERYIRAREGAEAMLRSKPNSPIARWVLGRVYHLAEGNLPRALYQLRFAEKSLSDRRWTASAQRAKKTYWHRRILLAQEVLLGEMDRRREQLALLERYERHHGTPLPLRRIWPLMKLKRFAEAYKLAEQATLAKELNTRIAGYNGLLSIEFERQRPVACFDVAMRGLNATAERSCILDLNSAEAAFAVYRFDEAERLAIKSIRAPLQDCPTSAQMHLANLYLLRADFKRTLSAIKAARAQQISPRLRQHFETNITAWISRLLFALGRFQLSEKFAQRVVQSPDRMGLISYSADLMRAIHLVDSYSSRLAVIEYLREKISARPLWQQWRLVPKLVMLRVKAWAQKREAAKALHRNSQILPSLLRPYFKPMPTWNNALLAKIGGDAIVSATLDTLVEREPLKAKTTPYFSVIRGQIAYDNRRYHEALSWADKALKRLPEDEVLLRARTAAWAADAARRRGKKALATDYYHRVLRSWPTALRISGIRLPVVISADSSPFSRRVALALAKSRRIRADTDRLGFFLRIRADHRDITICLTGRKDQRYQCVKTAVDPRARTHAPGVEVITVLDRFHATMFTPMIDLTQQDIRSLDGSAVRGHADDIVKEIFGHHDEPESQ